MAKTTKGMPVEAIQPIVINITTPLSMIAAAAWDATPALTARARPGLGLTIFKMRCYYGRS